MSNSHGYASWPFQRHEQLDTPNVLQIRLTPRRLGSSGRVRRRRRVLCGSWLERRRARLNRPNSAGRGHRREGDHGLNTYRPVGSMAHITPPTSNTNVR